MRAGHVAFNEGHIHALDAALGLSAIAIPVPPNGGLDVISAGVSGYSTPQCDTGIIFGLLVNIAVHFIRVLTPVTRFTGERYEFPSP